MKNLPQKLTILLSVIFVLLIAQTRLGDGNRATQATAGNSPSPSTSPASQKPSPISWLVPFANAETGSFSGTGQEAICRNGGRDWTSFISAVIDYDDFVEYWRDITGMPPLLVNSRYNRNYCLFVDEDNLLNQIKKVREQIRKAFYACDPGIPKLKKTYFRLEAELFFLRKVVTINSPTFLEAKDDDVYKQLRAYFVLDKGFVTDDEMKKLFGQFKQKYQARRDSYINCKDPTWENLIQKFKELKEHISGGFGIKGEAERIGRSADQVFNTPLHRTGGNLFGGLADFKVNNVSPKEALSDILDEVKKQSPDGLTFDQLQAKTTADVARYDDQIQRATYLAEYDHLYKKSSGPIINNIIDRLKYLEGSITATFPFINQTTQCVKGVLDRAC